jgi:lysozyme
MNKISNHGIAIIKNFEGLRLHAYQDIAGIWTIGYGSTRSVDGKPVKKGDQLATEVEAEKLFTITLDTFITAVNRSVKVLLTQNQFDALISFTYNVGTGAMAKSTLVKKLNLSDYAGAAEQILVWNKITNPQTGKKQPSKTLTNRREQERALFLKP